MQTIGIKIFIPSALILTKHTTRWNTGSPNGSDGSRHKVTKGIKQGCVLSPLLFTVFMNPLLQALTDSECGYKFEKNHKIHVPGVQYMDDLTLLANN